MPDPIEKNAYLEFHRHAAALVPEPSDPDPGLAVMVCPEAFEKQTFTCNCRQHRKTRACPHVRNLAALVQGPEVREMDRGFRESLWYQLAVVLNENLRLNPSDIRMVAAGDAATGPLSPAGSLVLDAPFGKLAVYTPGPGQAGKERGLETRLLKERCGLGKQGPFHRAKVLELLRRMTWSETEHQMAAKNARTRRQALEESFWFQLMYHCSRFTDVNLQVQGRVDETDGLVSVICGDASNPKLRLYLPKENVWPVFSKLAPVFENREEFKDHPHPLVQIVKVTADAKNRLVLRRCLLLRQPGEKDIAMDHRLLVPFRYGGRVYLKDRKRFAIVTPNPELDKLFAGKTIRRFKPELVPGVLDQLGKDLFAPPNIIDGSVRKLNVYKHWDRIEVTPHADPPGPGEDKQGEDFRHARHRDWGWLSVHYGFGDRARVSLADIYKAKTSGQRFLEVADGWVDVQAFDLDSLTGLPGSRVSGCLADGRDSLNLSSMDLFRLKASTAQPLVVSGQASEGARPLEDLLTLKPPEPYQQPSILGCELRAYQQRGVEWLMFLHENGFGGLLCDDMGLGKTHQVMALMAWLLERRGETRPFLVVCPTTVISHWRRKLEAYTPGLLPLVYYGGGRVFPEQFPPGRVIITSYRVLLLDAAVFAATTFGLAVFDEAQHLKNTSAKTHGAARLVPSAMTVCVTGTPVENRLMDIKALMDLAVPGYLGLDDAFAFRYGLNTPGGPPLRRDELRRLLSPFVLRRMKTSVLSELPEKIEDIRFCALTEVQVKLYRDAVDRLGKPLLTELRSGDRKNIPYLHIFAFLSLLKQICNHPATVSGAHRRDVDEELTSGKWDLFCELLDECLDSGQKVVVYSQFTDMVRMIAEHAEKTGAGVVELTGSTRNRGEVIDRFNRDPACRVFAGSLKAGGVGIDLTAASVVIHYDRWWNAAREDQATDRVHRIGQTRGVQVFKLVTEGTLEEKISAMIAEKKQLMRDIVQEDDPGLLKTFSPEDLMRLMAPPEANSLGLGKGVDIDKRNR